jgi:hypothetical protein
MQKTTKTLVAIAVPCALATNLFAGLTTTLNLSPSGYRDPNSVGGEFTAVVAGGANYVGNYNSKATASGKNASGQTVTGFETFCVEMTADFQPGSTYNTTVSSAIIQGPSQSMAITVGTAYLYSQFAQGTLSGYNYTSGAGRELSADELQDAIWYLQGEITKTGNGMTSDSLYTFNSATDPFVALVDSKFGSDSASMVSDTASGNSNYGVLALNLTSTGQYGQTVYDQDQLVYCPVPEPATFAAGAMLLLPLGLSAVRSFQKKKE